MFFCLFSYVSTEGNGCTPIGGSSSPNFTILIQTQCEDNVHIINDKVISYLMLNSGSPSGWIEFDSMTLKNAEKNRYKLCIAQRGK